MQYKRRIRKIQRDGTVVNLRRDHGSSGSTTEIWRVRRRGSTCKQKFKYQHLQPLQPPLRLCPRPGTSDDLFHGCTRGGRIDNGGVDGVCVRLQWEACAGFRGGARGGWCEGVEEFLGWCLQEKGFSLDFLAAFQVPFELAKGSKLRYHLIGRSISFETHLWGGVDPGHQLRPLRLQCQRDS